MNKNSGFNRMMGIVFMTILVGMFCFNALLPDNEFSAQENRMLQQFPKLSVGEYMEGRLESKLEDYANDQILMRSIFIRIKTAVDVSAGVIHTNGVWKSKDSYLVQDATVPSEERLQKDAKALKSFKAKHKKLRMYFMLVPNAVSVYGDRLPLAASVEDQNKYMDEMFEASKEAGLHNIDVREHFMDIKDDKQLFYRTDHHWTSDGAYEAFKYASGSLRIKNPMEFELMPVSNRFIGTLASESGFVGGKADEIKLPVPKDRSKYKHSVIYYEDTKEKTTSFYKLENLELKDAYTVFGGGNHPVYTIKTPVKKNRRLLLVKDSYANSMIPYLMQYYREIVVVDPRYYYDDIDTLMEIEGVNEVLFLYNANTYFGDDSLAMMLSE